MARKRFLFFHRRYSFLKSQRRSKGHFISSRRTQARLVLGVLFIGAWLITQVLTTFWDANRLPVSAQQPSVALEGHPALQDGDSPFMVHGSWFIAMNNQQSTMNKTADGIPPHPVRDGDSSRFKVEQGMDTHLAVSPEISNSGVSLSLQQDSSNPTSLLERGRVLYEAGNFSEAVEVLRTAVEAFKAEGNTLQQAMALSNLALAYQQLGNWSEAEQALTESLNLLQSGERTNRNSRSQAQILAQTLDIQGRLQLSLGRAEQALETWEKAAALYAQIGNREGLTWNQINQAQALQSAGFYTRACRTLLNTLSIDSPDCGISEQQLETLKSKPDSLSTAVALRNLGDVLQLVGDLQQSQKVLELSRDIARRLQSPENISAALFSLGNTVRAQQTIGTEEQTRSPESPISFYQQAAEQATSPTLKIQAQLNQLSLLIENQQFPQAQELWPEIQSQLDNLPPSRAAVYARINLAESLMELSPPQLQAAAPIVAKAVDQAKGLGDQRATAYALGNLGQIYEQSGQLKEGQDLTEQALILAQTIDAPDIAYRWQWQLGRLLKDQGKEQDAIAAYNSAISTLRSLRGDLVNINPNVQFSFRESVEPVYRQLVELLLQPQAGEENLGKARDIIESLQLAELVNFFREDCLSGTPVQIDEIDANAAVIYPIVLPDRLEVVLSLPNAPLRHYATNLPQAEVEKVFTDLRIAIDPSGIATRAQEIRNLEPEPNPQQEKSSVKNLYSQTPVPETDSNLEPKTEETEIDPNRGIGVQPVDCSNSRSIVVQPRNCAQLSRPQDYLPLAQKTYDWLIRPGEQAIANSGVKTLVFVLDGPLLNVPMAVLNNGQQFLIENYAIAYTPGLQLLDTKPLTRGKLSALKAGISEARQLPMPNSEKPLTFSALPFVKEELLQIQKEISGQILLNEAFTTNAIENQIDSVPFRVVHLATHGQFSSNEKDTFIVTWDDRLNVNQLNTVLRTREETGRVPIELLVLSACQTATGDERAALGLAGVAVRAGARSTLATLWFVSDEATAEVMTRFYQKLTDTSISKAEALRLAQVELLRDSRYQKPLFWAPYVLVGNWL
jgi:CHAT domain-containing protein/Flp pilus assembly protein TadD